LAPRAGLEPATQ